MSATSTHTKSKNVSTLPHVKSGKALMAWRQKHGIARPIFAKIADFSERKLATYESSSSIPKSGHRRVMEAVRLLEALQQLAGDDQALKDWLLRPNPAFQKRAPLDLVTHGESDLIWSMVHQLRDRSYE